MAEQIGRLFVNIDANVTPTIHKLRKLDEAVIRVAENVRNLNQATGKTNGAVMATGRLGREMDKLSASSRKAQAGVDGVSNAARRGASPMNSMVVSTKRLSEAFINLRYGNPLGVFAGLAQAAKSAGGGIGGLTGQMGSAAGATAVLSVAMGGLAAAGLAVAAAVAGAAVGVGLMAKNGLSAAADFEMLKIQYEGMIGSATAAQQEVDYLLSLGAQSVVPTEQLLEANRQLLAFGITEAGLRQNMLKFIADYGSAAGLSTGQVQNLSYVIGQINAQGRAYTQDIRQLATASVGVDKLAAALGITTVEFQKMVEEGKATADVVLPAILKIGESAEEAAEKARNSARGIIANLGDIAKVKMGVAFEDLLEKIKPALKWVEAFISAFDFSYIAETLQIVGQYFADTWHKVFGDTTLGAEDTANTVAMVIGNIVNVVGFAITKIVDYWQAMYFTVRTVWEAIASGVQFAMSFVVDKVATVIGWAATVGEAFGQSWGDSLRATEQSALNWASNTSNAAWAAGNAMVANAGRAYTAWNNVFSLDGFKTPVLGANNKPPSVIPPATFGGLTPGPVDLDKKGAKKEDERFAKWKDHFSDLLKLMEKMAAAMKVVRDLLDKPFGTESGLQKALSFGSADSNWQANTSQIINVFKTGAGAIRDYFDAMGGGEERLFGKKAYQAARAQGEKRVNALRRQVQQMVDLAEENKRLEKELADWQRDRTKDLNAQMDALERTYSGYIDVNGKSMKGLIESAQDAVDAATKAYDEAYDKLQDLIAARDDFLRGILDSARSFVNSLTVDAEMVQEFRRLDDVGSFIITEKQKTKSIKEQMAERLKAMKEWAANIKKLREQGLDSGLLQDLIAAGPEGSGAAVAEIANGGKEVIDEINAIQGELGSVVGDLSGAVNDWFFASGIGAQEAVVAQAAAAKALAEQHLIETTERYNAAKLAIQAQLDAVAEGADEHSLALKAAMAANAETAATVAADIENALAWLTDKKQNPKNVFKLGEAAIQGLIKGLESKEPALIQKAEAIANRVAATIARALQINSPSRLMVQYGQWVGEGLSIGMESSIPKIEAAAMRISGASLPSLDGGAAAPTVKVFIGDTELRDIVDVQIDRADAQVGSFVMTGRRI